MKLFKYFFCFLNYLIFFGPAIALEKHELGTDILMTKPAYEFKMDFFKSKKITIDEKTESSMKFIDLDNDGQNDQVYMILYNQKTKFKADTETVDLFDSKTRINKMNGMEKVKNLPPDKPTYAIAVILSSLKNKIYILQNSTFFPKQNQTYTLLGTTKIDKNASSWQQYKQVLLNEKLSPNLIKGDILEMAGCFSPGKVCYDQKSLPCIGQEKCNPQKHCQLCNYVAGFFWDGARFRFITLGDALGD